MNFYIEEAGSVGREFETEEKFIQAIKDLIDTYREQGQECFQIVVVND